MSPALDLKALMMRMREVDYPAYRRYATARREANDAIMALLAGSRLASHTLQLTEGSQRLLPEIFPAVPHIWRFNLTTENARKLLLNADAHLGAVTVPYALAIHEDLVMSSLDMLKSAGLTILDQGKQVRAWNMHEVLFRTTSSAEPHETLDQFHLLREMRNSLIHEGGKASTRLQAAIGSMSAASSTTWQYLTGRTPADIISSGKVVFTVGDILASFAVIKELGRRVNAAMQKGMLSTAWAKIVVEDHARETSKIRNSAAWIRALNGYSRYRYGALSLAADELESAAISLGLWIPKNGGK